MRPLVTSYRQSMALFPSTWHRLGLALAVAALLLVPWLGTDRWITVANLSAIAVVGSVGLMIAVGFCGQISLGHAAFLAIGAYCTAVLGDRYHVPFWLLLPASGVIAAAVGVGIGFFALRLKGLYLAIVTIGLVYLVQHVLFALPQLTGGTAGISVPMFVLPGETAAEMEDVYETMAYGPLVLDFSRKLYVVFVSLAVATIWLCSNLRRSHTGRAMFAVRDRDLAAAALGISNARTKVAAFAISSFFGGVAGSMFALQQQYLTIEPFNLALSVEYIAMVVIGGIGTVFGAVAGALCFTILVPLLEDLGSILPLISSLSSAQQSTVLFSIIVCAFLVFEPLGLLGLWLRAKRYFISWPFRY